MFYFIIAIICVATGYLINHCCTKTPKEKTDEIPTIRILEKEEK